MNWDDIRKHLKKYFPPELVEKWNRETRVIDVIDDLAERGWGSETTLHLLADAVAEYHYGSRAKLWEVYNDGSKAVYRVMEEVDFTVYRWISNITIRVDDMLGNLFS